MKPITNHFIIRPSRWLSKQDKNHCEQPSPFKIRNMNFHHCNPELIKMQTVPNCKLLSQLAMTVLVPHITQAATVTVNVINVIIVFLQYTLTLALIPLLIYFIWPVNSALMWNVISHLLHLSLWPTLLRTDSSSAHGTGFCMMVFSYLSLAVTVLVAIASVFMPLGLSLRGMLPASPKIVLASFVADTSPLSLATSPRAQSHLQSL
jgi:hypothetical protein